MSMFYLGIYWNRENSEVAVHRPSLNPPCSVMVTAAGNKLAIALIIVVLVSGGARVRTWNLLHAKPMHWLILPLDYAHTVQF